MWMQYQDEEGPLATIDDACREYALNVGRERVESAWILTDYDTWQPNPFYTGPAVRHPEDDYYEEIEEVDVNVNEIDEEGPF